MARKHNTASYFEALFNKRPEFKDKYDYTSCEIDGLDSKLVFKCLVCGHINKGQTARTHKDGNGCTGCNNHHRFSKEYLVTKSTEKFGAIFDFSLVSSDLKHHNDSIEIGCPRHGIVETTPQLHLKYQKGCPLCLRYDAEEVSELFYKHPRNLHLSFTDLAEDLKGKVKVRFIRMECPYHGTYTTRLNGVLRGNGCLKCYHERAKGLYNSTLVMRDKDTYLNMSLSIYLIFIKELDCYKIGLTNNMNRRMAAMKSDIGFTPEVLYVGLGNAYDTILLEEGILSELSEYKFKSPISFGGHTELFKVCPDKCSDIIEFLATCTIDSTNEE